MKKSKIISVILLPAVALGCILLLVLLQYPANVANNAIKVYGPSSKSLDIIEETYLASILLLKKEALVNPPQTFQDDIQFEITLGESPHSVSTRLQAAGIISDAALFRHYLIYKGYDTQIQAGSYQLNFLMTPIDIGQALLDPIPTHIDFVILGGWRAEEIAAALPTSGLTLPPGDFLQAVADQQAEGYLFPGTYTLARDISAELMVRTFVNGFDRALSAEIQNGLTQQGLTVQEAVKLASIIEREAIIDDEMPLIASVFLNRYRIGMKLDADPTVQYALGFNDAQATWWTNPLSAANLEVDSPYNTYRYAGLPPTAICNPGLNALRAVAFPAETPYFYFRATCDHTGRHNFAITFEDHVRNGCP